MKRIDGNLVLFNSGDKPPLIVLNFEFKFMSAYLGLEISSCNFQTHLFNELLKLKE